ncbi:MAG: GxxExxY protein [Bacteroidaceae bacterium]|nr:GxxExxY protein [Bacteroidaceae bacterium]
MTKKEWLHIYEIVGAAMEVYNELGWGMAEPIYQSALKEELELRGIPYKKEEPLKTYYKGKVLDKVYIADFLSEDVVIELKSVDELNSSHRAQLFNYLRITHTVKGLLINFGEPSLHCERYIYIEDEDRFELLTQQNFTEFIE